MSKTIKIILGIVLVVSCITMSVLIYSIQYKNAFVTNITPVQNSSSKIDSTFVVKQQTIQQSPIIIEEEPLVIKKQTKFIKKTTIANNKNELIWVCTAIILDQDTGEQVKSCEWKKKQ